MCIDLDGCAHACSTVDTFLCPWEFCDGGLQSVFGFVCITAMISDLHLFYGMAGMRIISRLEKVSCF